MNFEHIDQLLREVPRRTLAIAGTALLALGVVAGVLYGVKPAFAEYTKLDQQHRIAMDGLMRDEQGGASSAIADLEIRVAKLRNELYGGAAAVPRREIESFVVNVLDSVSMRHGVNFLGITPDRSKSVWMFEELPYKVRAEGAYFAIHRWLFDVEEELRPMVVKQFELSPNSDRGAVILDLSVVAYRAVEEGIVQ